MEVVKEMAGLIGANMEQMERPSASKTSIALMSGC